MLVAEKSSINSFSKVQMSVLRANEHQRGAGQPEEAPNAALCAGWGRGSTGPGYCHSVTQQ